VIELAVIDTPIDSLTLAARNGRVCLLHFGADGASVRAWLQRWYPADAIEQRSDPGGAASALVRYFAGDLDAIDSVRVEMNGTPFQKRVWDALRQVPAGRTATYAEIAVLIGSPAAVRAVGAANGANPVAVVVPCHRIIGSNGTLTGYGGGLNRKQWLLRHEGRRLF
jgi:methylated-DNA-[protein]-cysteine S-methyltransferase